ncbi:MAG: glycosyltransferase family 4 protein, partial [Desulfurococcaceae archaeon]|nr:glycosyltransferase family 4 protein [Desulfurococcaceae archaeon]
PVLLNNVYNKVVVLRILVDTGEEVLRMYALIVHHYWNRAGGGELVCAAFAKVFESMGLEPVLASTVKIDVSRYPEWFGIDLSSYRKIDFGVELRAFGIYLRLLHSIVIKKAVKVFKPAIVFLDAPTYRRALKTIRKFGSKLVEYIHFPQEAWFMREFPEFYYKTDPYLAERYGRFPMNIYFSLFTKLLKLEVRENPFRDTDLVMANSKWTADLVKKIYGEAPVVLNPPLPPSVGVVENPRPFDERSNTVVMVGRFSEEKRYHWVIKDVFPKLRKVLGDVKLFIFGATDTRTARMYFSKLIDIARSTEFKVSTILGIDADIYLIENAPRDTINMVMDKAKVFLHATINEHWGIAVAEAMARGLPVVVHRSGGTWSDLAGEGVYGLGYTTDDEAVEMISKVLSDNSTWRYYSTKSIERAKDLTFDRFVEKTSQLIKKIL